MRLAIASDIGPRARNNPASRAQITYLPAPTQGWDTETPAYELPQTLARVLDNFIPRGQALQLRKGYSDHVTGGAAAVETLMPYNAGASSALFAAIGTAIYNVTSAGALGASVVSSLTSARFSYTNFTTSGGMFLWVCNGADDPRHWNGTTWATPSLTITTYTDNDISYVLGFKERLYFIFKNTLTFGYLPVQSIAGTVSNFPLGSVFNRGGRLVALGTISRDNGDGLDDLFVALSSQGEAVVYQGSNPASDFSLVGIYYVGEPVGDRPFVDLGDDLGVITRNGLVSMMHMMAGLGEKETTSHVLTAPIATTFNDAVATGAGFNGWEGVFVPSENLLIVNGPRSGSAAYQYVRSRITAGWSRFTDWNFATFAVFGGELYAGGLDGNIYACLDAESDDGADITGRLATAWTALGAPVSKTLLEVRPVLTSNTSAVMRIVGRGDFRDRPALGAFPASVITNQGVWDVSSWDQCLWGGEDAATRQWRAISGEGHMISLVMEARAQSRLSINGFNLRFQIGSQV